MSDVMYDAMYDARSADLFFENLFIQDYNLRIAIAYCRLPIARLMLITSGGILFRGT